MRWRHYILAAGIFLSVALATVAIQIEAIQAGYRLDEAIVQLQETEAELDALDLALEQARSPEAVREFFRGRMSGDAQADPLASAPPADVHRVWQLSRAPSFRRDADTRGGAFPVVPTAQIRLEAALMVVTGDQ